MPQSHEHRGEAGGDRPRGTGFRALLGDSWALFSSHVTTLLALFLPAFLALSLTQVGMLAALDQSAIPELIGAFASVAVLFVLAGVVGSFAVGLAALVADSQRAGHESSIGAASRAIRPLGREVLGAALLSAVLAMASSFVGLYQILLPVFFGPPVIVHAIALEGLPLAGAWPRAKELLKGNWGRALLYLVVVSLVLRLIQGLVARGLVEAMGVTDEDTINFVLGGPVRGLLDGIALPFLAIAMYVLYRQLAAESADDTE